MNFKNTLIMLGMMAALTACKPADTNSTTTSTTPDAAAQTPAVLKEATLVCREIRNLDDISPLSEVSLKIGDKSTPIDSVSVCETFTKDMYEAHKIPKDAVAACGGWWAGAGDYLYLVYEGDDAVVMAGWQAEKQEDEGFHYEEIRRMSRK